MKKCKIVFNLGKDNLKESTSDLLFTIEDAFDKDQLGDNPLLDVAEFLKENPDKRFELLQQLKDYSVKKFLNDYSILSNSLQGSPNMSLETMANTFQIEGGWPDVSKFPDYLKYNIVYRNVDNDAGVYTYPEQGIIVVYRNGIRKFRNNLQSKILLQEATNVEFSQNFKRVLKLAQEAKPGLTEKLLLLDYLNDENYIYKLKLTKDLDPIHVIEQELNKILKNPNKFEYKTKILTAIYKRIKTNSVGDNFILVDDLVNIIKSIDSEFNESDVVKYLKDQINLDPEYPYKFRSKEVFDEETKTEIIYFNKIKRTTIEGIYKLKRGEKYIDKFKFVEIYNGYRIYEVEDNLGKRYYYTKGLISKTTILSSPYDKIEDITDLIDSKIKKENVNSGSIFRSLWNGENLVLSYEDGGLSLGSIFRVLDGIEEYNGESYWKKQYVYRNKTVQELLDELDKIKENLNKKLRLKIEVLDDNNQKVKSNLLNELLNTISKLITCINDDKDNYKNIGFFINLLISYFPKDEIKSTTIKSIYDDAEELIKKIDNINTVPEGVDKNSETYINKQNKIESLRRKLIKKINSTFSENFFFDPNKIDRLKQVITNPDKALAAVHLLSTLLDEDNPDKALDNIISTLKQKNTYSYYQVVQRLGKKTHALLKIKDPNTYVVENEDYGLYYSKLDQIENIVTGLNEKLQGTGYTIKIKSASLIKSEYGTLGLLRSSQKAFISGNEIIINQTLADLTTPLHEYIHIFLGIIKANNPENYHKFIETVATKYSKIGNALENEINYLIGNRDKSVYEGMSYYDIVEEAFANIYAKLMLTSSELIFSPEFKLDETLLKTEFKNIFDILDPKNNLDIEQVLALPLFKLTDLVSGIKNLSLKDENAENMKLLQKQMVRRRKITNQISKLLSSKVIEENCK